MFPHRLLQCQVEHVAEVSQGLGGQPAIPLQVPLCGPLIKKFLQI